MHKIHIHSFTALLAVLAFSTASFFVLNQVQSPRAFVSAADTACPSGSTIFVDNAAPNGSTALSPGVHKVSIAVPTTLAPSVKNVIFKIDSESSVLGRGVQVNNNPYWEMQWQTMVTPGGTHSIGATLQLTSGSCQVPFSPVLLGNTTVSGHLAVTAVPGYFEGYTNEPRNFVLHASTTNTGSALEVSQWAYFGISPVSLGVVTPADGSNAFRFSAGPSAGTAVIKVAVQYGGNTTLVDIPVKILAQTSTTTASGGASGTTSGTGATSAATGTASSSPTALESDAPVKQCVVSKIGEARYSAVTSGKERPTSAEFEAFALCFAIRNYVIPGSWAPVEAKKETIQSKPESAAIRVQDAATVTDDKGGTKKQALKFSGKAKPNAKVLLYIFSEPLVVATAADANGDWSYSLEDPLEPGKHEAYALVNKGDGSYERSSVFSFAVAKAEAASNNPNGLSLKVEKSQPTAQKNTASTKLYVAGVIILVVIVAGLALNLLRLRAGHAEPSAPKPDKPAAAPAQPPTVMDAAAKEPAHDLDKPGETIEPKDTGTSQ